jgi:hypothetical protein
MQSQVLADTEAYKEITPRSMWSHQEDVRSGCWESIPVFPATFGQSAAEK